MHALSRPSEPSTSRNLLSRLTSSFTSKARSNVEFHVEPNDPLRQYAPGDRVDGEVHLTVLKPMRVSHIVVCLHGYVKVSKTPGSLGDPMSRDKGFLTPTGGQTGTVYFGNGYTSIFEDEVIVCGDGRLLPKRYVFKFSTQFPENIPSSLDFERGTITYLITATLTRESAISPTISVDRKIKVAEVIDIAQIPDPKPRVVSLEPIRKSKTRPGKRTDTDRASGRPRPIEADRSSVDEGARSPAPSVHSALSGGSGSSIGFRVRPGYARSYFSDVQSNAPRQRTIRATAEILRGGCLPGDVIPIKVTIDHVKPIKSMQGIIVTLYRIGRVDTHPDLPIGTSKGKGAAQDEYYPKSRTGLGGLSLSSAGSSHTFRMDLAQAFAPLIIDPVSLQATVKTSVQMPDDVVQTYLNVPGGMISFRYMVEVIMDLRGNLNVHDRFLPRMSMTGTTSPFGYQQSGPYAGYGGQPSHFIDTAQIRRERSVVYCTFDVVVGTKDTSRRARQRPLDPWETAPNTPRGGNTFDRDFHQRRLPQRSFSDTEIPHQQWHRDCDYDGVAQDVEVDAADGYESYEHEEPVDEKTQIRQAELRLLPSVPPTDGAGPSSLLPSAPPLDDGDEREDVIQYGMHDEMQETQEMQSSSAPAYSRLHSTTYDRRDTDTAVNAHPSPILEDKQELERLRLLDAASAPPGLDEDEDVPPRPMPVPTAPRIDDHDEAAGSSTTRGDAEQLPEYRK